MFLHLGTVDTLTGEFFVAGDWGRGEGPVHCRMFIIIMAVLGLYCSTCVSYMILVPPPGIEPASPALEGGFLTTGPPENPLRCLIASPTSTH